MKTILRCSSLLLLFLSVNLLSKSQVVECPGQIPENTPDFSGSPVQIAGSFNLQYDAGDVYRFFNVVTVPYTIHVDVGLEAIVNTDIEELDDNTTRENRFQPLLDPNPDYIGNSQNGYVQYTMVFRRASDLAVIPFQNLVFSHENIDGRIFTVYQNIRENSWISNASSVNPGVLLTDQGTVADGFTWKKILGDAIEHDPDYNPDPTVAYTANINPTNVLRFRCGYEYVHNVGADTITIRSRDYSIGFGCLEVPPNVPLPVKLLSFNGSMRNNNAMITWVTESEVNFEKFEIQRSSNGFDFITQGSFNSRGNTNAKAQYNFTDNLSNLYGKAFYYRLKMNDIDGKVTYSQVLVMQKQDKIVKGLQLTPNPVYGSGTIRLTSGKHSTAEFRVIDLNGKVVVRQRTELFEGNNSISLNEVSRLKPGLYILQMQNEQQIINTKFTVAR